MSTPLSTIEFYKIPALSPNYRDTYYFSSASDQYTFFHGQGSPKALNSSQYTRVTNNKVKVPFPQSEMIDYNYMRIQNALITDSSSNTGRNIYCFVTNVEYVSDMCSLITFKVDVIQTFLPSATIRESFVERCHSKTDVLFENREPEPFSIQNYSQDYGSQDTQQITLFMVLGIVGGTRILFGSTAPDPDGYNYTTTSGFYVGNQIASGSEYFIFNGSVSGDRSTLNDILESLRGREDAITDFYCVPQLSYWDTTGGTISRAYNGAYSGSWTVHCLKDTQGNLPRLSGYTPTNLKLYNYPYCFLRLINNIGDSLDLLFEEFSLTTQQDFLMFGSWYGGGACIIYPRNYEGTLQGDENRQYSLSLEGFPYCSYKSNAYDTWRAQKENAQIAGASIGMLGSIIGSIASGTIDPIGGAISTGATISKGAQNVASLVEQMIEAKKKPNTIHNNKNSPMPLICNAKYGFTCVRMSAQPDELEQIDNYFTMFGYAQNKIMNVRTYLNDFENGNSRAKFVYIKTNGFSVQGSFPNEYKEEFNEVFNNGITFWKTTATVGNYSNNSPHTPS